MSLRDTIMIPLLALVSTKPPLTQVFMVVHVISDTDKNDIYFQLFIVYNTWNPF